jgi:hypothetical protein
MTPPDNATRFFHACESVQGWDACSQFVAPGAKFKAQSEPLVDIKTIEEYVNWMTDFCNNIAPGGSYELHSSAYDDVSKTAVFFATYTLTHTGDGGPVPPTHKETNTHYVYVFYMNDEGNIRSMQKVWNAPWAMRELGWM